ncbi:hypothetical protein UlMin_039200 [Ulmus minor]
MDNKAWLWRKKSTEKNALESDKALNGNEEEIQTLLAEKAEMEKCLKTCNDKLSSALSECNSKDELVKKHAKMAQEAVKGWEKAEEEAVTVKLQLDKALQLRVASEERLAHLDAALKECMQQLRFVREEQEKRIHDAVMKTSREFEKSQMFLEEKLSETNKKLNKIVAENAHLGKGLVLKEKLIEELNRQLNQVEADFNALMARLESTEKDNASLKYEVRVLEKELEIRNEEREFNRRTVDQSHKQHLENVKKVAKLESECQRLRILVRKRLPGPAALAKMKNEVEMLGRDSVDSRRKSNMSSLMFDSMGDNSCETPTKRSSMLTEQLSAMEEENKNLREVLVKKTDELQLSRNLYARAAYKLTHVESKLEESPKGPTFMEPRKSNLMSNELSLASMSDIGSDDKASCAESWASALISELEHFRNEKQKGSLSKKTVGASDMSLMDDFVEMEKLAIVSVDKPAEGSHVSSNVANPTAGHLETEYSSEALGTEIVPVSDSDSVISVSNQEIKHSSNGKNPVWLQDTLKLILGQNHATGRSPQDILEDIRVALACQTRPDSNHFDVSNHSPFGGNNSSKHSNKSRELDSPSGVAKVDNPLSGKSSKQLVPDLSKPISKMIEVIEGISLPSPDNDSQEKSSNSETPAGYIVRAFQWKTSELSAVLQQCVHTCYDLLNGKADVEIVLRELTTALEWIINHCFSVQDVSSMRDAIIKQFDWDETRSESEAEVGMMVHFSDKSRVSREQMLCLSPASLYRHSIQMDELKSAREEEGRKLKEKLMNTESAKKELEGELQSATDMSKYLMNQLHESEKAIASLQQELTSLKESKGVIEDQIENHKMKNEDLDTQLTVARVELNEAREKFTSLEVELENKKNSFEELQATCVELQLQLESVKKESPDPDIELEDEQLRTDMEITTASEKLAECQETILNLGKQLKALAAPREAALFDKVITNPSNEKVTTDTTKPTVQEAKSINRRASLLDQMLAEDDAKTKNLKSPDTKEIDDNSTALSGPNRTKESLEKILALGDKHPENNAGVESLAIVPSKKQGGRSLWKKLLWRKKKGSSKKPPLSLAS